VRDGRGVVGGPVFPSFNKSRRDGWARPWQLRLTDVCQDVPTRSARAGGIPLFREHNAFPIASRIDKREHTHTKLHPPKCSSSSSSSQVPVGPGSTKTNQTSQTPSDVDSENYLPSSGPMNYNKNDNDVPRYYYARLGGLGPKTCVNFVTLFVWKDEEDLRMNGNLLFGETTTQ
jgi:hypothetical protein